MANVTLEQWLENRRSMIGASESPAVLGVGYSGENQHTIWMRKMGLEPPRVDSEALDWGHEIQPAILRMFSRRTGIKVHDLGQFTIQRSAEFPFVGATLDGVCETDDGRGVVEAKNVGIYNRAEWEQADPPLRVSVQIQHQLIAADAQYGFAVACIGGNKLVWKRIERNDRFITAMLAALRKFWRYVESKTAPPIDATEGCSDALKAMYPRDTGTSVGLPEESVKWFNELSALKRAIGWIEDRKRFVENQVKAAIGDATDGILPDGRRFSWKSQTNKYPPKPAHETTFRVLRQHERKSSRLMAGDTLEQRLAHSTTALLAMGGTLYHESPSGSRYFELAGGLRVRVSDHAPNSATAKWMGRDEVAAVRVDQDDWKDQLTAITGPLLESEG